MFYEKIVNNMNSVARRLCETCHITKTTTKIIENDHFLSYNYQPLNFNNKISCVSDGNFYFNEDGKL